jgi:hypothetical protein
MIAEAVLSVCSLLKSGNGDDYINRRPIILLSKLSTISKQ